MSSLNVTVTAPLQEFITIVNELGYQEFVVLNVNGEASVVPNPENQQTFLQNYVKTLIVDDFTKVKIRAIDNAIHDERTAEKDALKTAIAAAVNVNFVV